MIMSIRRHNKRPVCIWTGSAPRHSGRAFGTNDVRFALFIILAVAGSGCGRGRAGQHSSGDEVMRQQVVGSWNFANGYGVLTLKPDGSFSSQATNQSKKFAYAGTWGVSSGELVMCLTKSSEPQFQPLGQTNRLKILELTRDSLVDFDPLLDQTNTLRRDL